MKWLCERASSKEWAVQIWCQRESFKWRVVCFSSVFLDNLNLSKFPRHLLFMTSFDWKLIRQNHSSFMMCFIVWLKLVLSLRTSFMIFDNDWYFQLHHIWLRFLIVDSVQPNIRKRWSCTDDHKNLEMMSRRKWWILLSYSSKLATVWSWAANVFTESVRINVTLNMVIRLRAVTLFWANFVIINC